MPVLSATVYCWPKGDPRPQRRCRRPPRAQLRRSEMAAQHPFRRRTLPPTPDQTPNGATHIPSQPDQLSPQSQSLSQSYGSVLPTSLTYICLSNQRLLTLETCCGYRVRPSTKLTTTHSDFQGPTRALRTAQEPRCFTVSTSLSPGEPIPGTRYLTKKRQLFPGLGPTFPSSFPLPVWLRPKAQHRSVSRFGNINPIPFRGTGAHAPNIRAAFAGRLGPTDPCSTAVHMEPFSSLVLKGLT